MDRGRGTSWTLGVVLFGAALVLAGCQARTTDEVIPARAPDPDLLGRFFVTAGELKDLGLFEMRLAPERLYRLSDVGRIGGIGACQERLVVSAAQQAVGFQDTLHEFREGKLGPVDGLGLPQASLPELAPDCRVVFSQVDRSAPKLVEELAQWDPATGETTVLHSAPEEIGVPDWGPGGRVAVLEGVIAGEQAPKATGLVLVSPDRTSKVVEPPVPEFGALKWGDSGWIAIGQREEKTVFFHPDTGEREELAGWMPLAWSPDGSRLLVADSDERRDLGIVEASDRTHVRKVARVGASLWDVVWLPEGALPDILLPTGRPDF